MRIFLLAPLLAAIPGLCNAQPLTFDQALARAGGEAPSVRARLAEVEARRTATTAAGQLPDPKLGLGLDNFPISGPPAFTTSGDSMTMGRVGLSLDVPNLAKRRAERGRAQAEVGASEALVLVETRRVKVETALAWIDLAYAQRRLTAIDRVLARLRSLVPASNAGVASGSARPAQALDVRQAIAATEDKRSEIAADLQRARAMLSRWTGVSEPEIAGEVPDFGVNGAALRSNLQNNPDLAAAIARTRKAEADVTAARADKRPDFGFDLAYQRRAERYGDMVSAGVTISLPLFTKRRQDPMIAASSSAATAARFDEEDTRRSVAADLEAALADHVMHHEQWMRASETLLPLARRKAELETASYSAGRASLLDVVQAQSMLADTELETLTRESVVVRDAARLVLTYGGMDQ